MKKLLALIIVLSAFIYAAEHKVKNLPFDEVYGPPHLQEGQKPTSPFATRIDNSSDMRAIKGTAGKNIACDTTGDNIAVIYGYPAAAPNIFQCKVGYSTNRGANWRLFGPFTVNLSLIHISEPTRPY